MCGIDEVPRQDWTWDAADAALSILLPRRADGVDRAADGSLFLGSQGGLLQKLTEASVLFCVGNLDRRAPYGTTYPRAGIDFDADAASHELLRGRPTARQSLH